MGVDPTSRPLTQRDLDVLITDAQRLEESPSVHTKRIFERNAMGAAQSIVNLALASTNDGVRLKAAQYVVDRTLGRVQDAKPVTIDPDDPWSKLAADCVRDMEPEKFEALRASVHQAKVTPSFESDESTE